MFELNVAEVFKVNDVELPSDVVADKVVGNSVPESLAKVDRSEVKELFERLVELLVL